MIDTEYLRNLEERIIARAKDEWPGFRETKRGHIITGPVREGGATDTLIHLVAKIAVEELNDL